MNAMTIQLNALISAEFDNISIKRVLSLPSSVVTS